MSLRDLVVSIDFDDINIRNLLNVDDAMNEIEDSFRRMGGDITDAGRDFNRLGSQGSGAMDEITSEAQNAGDALNEIGGEATGSANDITRAMDNAESAINQIDSASNEAGDALNQLGNDGHNAANDISNATDDVTSALNEIRTEAGQAEGALDQLGDAGRQSGNQTENAMDDASDATNDAGGSAQDAAGSFGALGTVGAKAAAAIAAGFTSAYGAIVLTVAESEKAFDMLDAKTGATTEQLGELKSVVKDVYSNGFGESLDADGDVVAQLYNTMGDIPKTELAELSKDVLAFSDIFGTDVNEAITGTKTTMTNFKLDGKEALDYITYASRNTAGAFRDDLMDALTELAPTFNGMGANAEQAFAMMIQASKSGMENFDGLSSLTQSFTDNMLGGSKDVAESYKQMGGNAEKMFNKFQKGEASVYDVFVATSQGLGEMKDKVAAGSLGASLFGDVWTEAGAEAIISLGGVSDTLDGVKGSIDDASSAAYDNFGDRMLSTFRKLKLRISEAFIENGGEELLNGIAKAAENLVPKIESMVEKGVDFANTIKDNWPAIRETTIGITTAVGSFAAIMGGLKVVGVVTTLINAYKAGTLTATLAQYGLNTAMLANPMTWVVAGIAALIAIGVLLWRNWDTVTEKAGILWDKLIDLKDNAVGALSDKFDDFKETMGEIKDKFLDFKDNAIQVTRDKFDDFKTTLEENEGKIITVAAILATVFGPALIGVATQATITAATVTGQFIMSLVRTGAQAVITGATVTASFIASMVTSAAQAIATGATVTVSFIGSLIRTSAQAVITGASLTVSLIGTMIRMSAQAVITGATMTISMIGTLIRFAAQGWVTLASMTAVTTGMIAQKVAMVAGAVVTGTMTAAQWALNVALNANPIGLVVLAIGALIAIGVLLYKNWDKIKAGASALWEKTKEVFGGIYDWGVSKIQPVVDFFKGLGDKFNDFKSAISNFKLPGWVSSIGKTLGGAASKVKGLFDGSHATGLARVPFDGYVAELHKDEAVLTASQADALRRTGILDNAGSKPQIALDSPEVTNKINIPDPDDNDDPKPEPRDFGGGGNQTTNVNSFSPQITINVESGPDGQPDHGAIAQAVKREMEKFWLQMQLKDA